MKDKQIWRRNLRAGVAFGCVLLAVGWILQASVGRIDWMAMAYPINVCCLAVFVAAALTMHIARRRVKLFLWLSSWPSAICSMAFTVTMTVAMGLTEQMPESQKLSGFEAMIGLRQMLTAWPFVLTYCWLTLSLTMTILRVLSRRNGWRRVPFILNHVGLLVALLTATLGNADMQRLKMTVGLRSLGFEPQAIAYDELSGDNAGRVMDFSLALDKFTVDEYNPQLAVLDSSGNMMAQPIEVMDTTKQGVIEGWSIQIVKTKELDGSLAVYVVAENLVSRKKTEGWVSCGSNIEGSHSNLPLDKGHTLVMPDREPRRFASLVTVYVRECSESKCVGQREIEVNKPLSLNGWKIYLLDYEAERKGASRYCVFELVRDPWLPFVYAGIFMMLAGALCLLFAKSPKQ